jgi:hypothetical protein
MGYTNFARDWSMEREVRNTPRLVVADPRCPLSAEQVAYLATVVPPMRPSANHGVDVYNEALFIVEQAGY